MPPSFSAPDGGGFFCVKRKKTQHHGHGKPRPPLLRFVCRAGCPHPAAGRRGRRPLQWRTENFPAMADVRGGLWAGRPTHRPQKGHPSRGLLQPCRGRACPARGLTESARLREPPRADIESAPTGNRSHPFCGLYVGRRTAGVHPANPSFNNNRRPSWKTSPAGGGLLCVNRV